MKYNLLGNTGLLVSELCFGTMTFGGDGWWESMGKLAQGEADLLVKQSFDGGINFFDTANVYSFGKSEKILGQSIKNLSLIRDEIVIATKVLGFMKDKPNSQGLSRYHIFNSVEESLSRLQLDSIDILYVHGVDKVTPIKEIMRSLNDIVHTGKVRYIGVSNWPAWMVMKAQSIARQEGWHEFKAMQYYYSLSGRDVEDELIPLAESEGLGFMPWSPLAGGFLSGKYSRKNTSIGDGSRRDQIDFPPINKDQSYDIIEVMEGIATNHKVSVAEVALSWVRLQSGVTSTIIGAKSEKQLASNIKSTRIKLSEEELNALNEASSTPKRYPFWMVDIQTASRLPKEE